MDEGRFSRIKRFKGLSGTLSRWKETELAVIGLGGLGCQLVQYLARLGPKRMVLVDRDVVAQENLGHQLLYTEEHAELSIAKAEAAKSAAKAINSAIEIDAHFANLTHQNIRGLLDGCAMIFDGLDNYSTRFLVNDYALSASIPYFYAGAVRGEVSAKPIIPGKTSCLRCIMPRPPAVGEIPTCAAEGVFPPLLGIAAALQVDLANRFLAGTLEECPDCLYSVQLEPWRIASIETGGPKADCPACGRPGFEYLDGMAGQSNDACAEGRVERQVPGGGLDLAQVAAKLDSGAGFSTSSNQYCLTAVNKGLKVTIFKHGYVIAEGFSGADELDAFMAEYLGI